MIGWEGMRTLRQYSYRRCKLAIQLRMRNFATIEGRERVLEVFGNERQRRNAACERTWAQWANVAPRIMEAGGISRGNKVTLYSCDEALMKMWIAIDNAQKSIHLETYILRLDYAGRKTIDHLQRALKRGVHVSLLYDSVGFNASVKSVLSQSILKSLRINGARVVEFNPILRFPWENRPHTIFQRNHRKMLMIDDSLIFCGGMNISDDYLPRLHGGTGKFHDTQVCIEGPAVSHFQMVVHDSVREAFWSQKAMEKVNKTADEVLRSPKTSLKPKNRTIISEKSRGVCVQVLMSNSWRNQWQLQNALQDAIVFSAKRVYITSPYFVPPKNLLDTIISAAERGVDVRILTAGSRSDVRLANYACRHLYRKLISSGARIYEYQRATLHTKSVSVDSIYSFIGSFNFDPWSYSRNLEVGMAALDTAVSKKVEYEFLEKIQHSKEIIKANLENESRIDSLMQWIAYSLAKN